jgi:hypothetical protein
MNEVKLVCYQPNGDFYTVDIYMDGERVHCGRGHFTPAAAWKEATDYLSRQVNPTCMFCG